MNVKSILLIFVGCPLIAILLMVGFVVYTNYYCPSWLCYDGAPILDNNSTECITQCYNEQLGNGLFVVKVAHDKYGCVCQFANFDVNPEINEKVKKIGNFTQQKLSGRSQ